MNEPEEVQRARKLVERGRAVVEEQRQRIERLRAIGASTDKAFAALGARRSNNEIGVSTTPFPPKRSARGQLREASG